MMSRSHFLRLLAPVCGALLLAFAPAARAQDGVGQGEGGRSPRPPAETQNIELYPAPAKTPEAAGEQFYDLLAALVVSNERDLVAREQHNQYDVQVDRSYYGLGSISRGQTTDISKSSVRAVRNVLTLFAWQKDEPQFEGKVVGTEGEQTLVEVSPSLTKKRAVVVIAEDGGYRVDLKATYGRWNNLSGDELDIAWYKLTGIEAATLANNVEFQRARENAQRSSCQSNLKQAMLGILQYAQDYDEKFPPARKWIDDLMPYVKSEQIFRCPALPPPPVGGAQPNYGYAYNQNLNSLSMAKMDNVAQLVAIYETEDLTRNAFGVGEERAYRHLGGSNIAFADGHVKWYAQGSEPAAEVNFKP